MHSISKLTLFNLIAIAALLIVGAAACAQPEPEKVVFMAGYKPQANLPFAAAYIAQEKGYFEEQGLDVEIRHASSGEHLQLLMSGDVDFTTADAASVLKRRVRPRPAHRRLCPIRTARTAGLPRAQRQRNCHAQRLGGQNFRLQGLDSTRLSRHRRVPAG